MFNDRLFDERKKGLDAIGNQQLLMMEVLMREDWTSFRDRAAGLDNFYLANATMAVSLGTTLTPADDVMHIVPVISPKRSRLAEFGVLNVVNALPQPCRFGIYQAISPDNLYPGDLKYDSGPVNVGPAPMFGSVLPDKILEEGNLYWLTFVRQQDLGPFTVQSTTTNQPIFCVKRARPLSLSSAVIGYTLAGVSGALPNPMPAGAADMFNFVASLAMFIKLARV